MSEPPVLLEIDDAGAAWITLNRPASRNAFDAEVIGALSEAFAAVHAEARARIVFLRGAGGVFSAGANLEWMAAAAELSETENHEDAMAMARMLKQLWDLPVLTVALVEGGAYGGGAGLAAACDIAIAHPAAKFSFSEVRLGLVAATISPYVVRAIGARNARALFATAEVFDAADAQRIGLVTEVADDLEAAASRLAEQIRACAPGAVAQSKDLLAAIEGLPIDEPLLVETSRRIAAARVGGEGQEGVRAFLSRTTPSWARR
jgi:methylglutaconyl-CoA hydratase